MTRLSGLVMVLLKCKYCAVDLQLRFEMVSQVVISAV